MGVLFEEQSNKDLAQRQEEKHLDVKYVFRSFLKSFLLQQQDSNCVLQKGQFNETSSTSGFSRVSKKLCKYFSLEILVALFQTMKASIKARSLLFKNSRQQLREKESE